MPDKSKFRPQTGRSPLTRKSFTGASIGAHLYQAHQEQRLKQQQVMQQREEQLRQQSKQSINEVSKQIMHLKQRQKLAQVFEALDSDGDGVISPGKINLQVLSAELLGVFKPLFEELEAFNECLDADEFVDSSLRLYKVTTMS